MKTKKSSAHCKPVKIVLSINSTGALVVLTAIVESLESDDLTELGRMHLQNAYRAILAEIDFRNSAELAKFKGAK